MKSSNRRLGCLIVFAGVVGPAPLLGQITVTLTARDSLGEVIRAPVSPGSKARVDIALSIDTQLIDASPIEDLHLLQLDFVATSDSVRLGTFRWLVNFGTYPMRTDALPRPSAESRTTTGTDLITLDETELIVATIEVTIDGRGTLNVVGLRSNAQSVGAQFEAGFNPVRRFTQFDGDIRGGTLPFVVTGADRDDDGIPDSTDAFPDDPDESVDTDDDGIGNNADSDDDDDNIPDNQDAFPLDQTESRDSDEDGVGDNADPFPNDPDESTDTDGDGVGNNADSDDDDDGAPDATDAFPDDPTEQDDSNGNGIGDNAEQDSNTGPRVTGGLCGAGAGGIVLAFGLGFAATRWRRWTISDPALESSTPFSILHR